MQIHSPLGGSKMHQWAVCPGSPAMQNSIGRVTSYAADEGSCAHHVAELVLKHGGTALDYLGRVFQGVTVDAEMAAYVQGYVDHCKQLANDPVFVEKQFTLHQIHPALFGMIDFATVRDRNLRLIDFKYGRKRVPSTYNYQLWYYAAGMLISVLPRETVDTVSMEIYQPRLFGDPEPAITVKADDVYRWANTALMKLANAASDPNAPRYPGDHCKFCSGKIACPEYKQAMQDYISAPVPLTNEQLAYLLSLKDTIAEFFSDVEAEADRRMMKGEDVPGYKLIKRYSKSSIKEQKECMQALAAHGLTPDQYSEQKLKTLTALRKIPEAQDIVNQYTVRGEVGRKIVKEDAKGDPVLIPTKTFGAINHE